VKQGQSVLQAAQKLADRQIKTSIRDAIRPISDEIKQYISTLVEESMPDFASEILMMDTHEIFATVLDFVEIYQSSDGIRVEINLESLTSLIESITSMVYHNPQLTDQMLEYFDNLKIDPEVIEGIVVSNINRVLGGN